MSGGNNYCREYQAARSGSWVDCDYCGAFEEEREPAPQFCGSCRYYENEACRRFPPARVYTGPASTDLNVTVWPVVRPTIDWCGEYERVPARR